MRTMVLFPKLNETLLARIREAAPNWNILMGAEADEAAVREAEIIFGWKKGLETILLSGASKVRWIQSWSAGMDHLDAEAFLSRGIELTSANGVHANPISETIFAMLLAYTRNLHLYMRNQTKRRWEHGNLRLELHGKTLGIVGVGAIGEETARIAKAAFGMRVLGLRRSGAPAPFVDEMYRAAGLLEMLPHCDYIASIVPATKETKHLFGEAEFRAMKPSAFFVNVGRGSTVDTDALLAALTEGRLAGAGLDVFEQEPLPDDHPFWNMENVIITPHSAGSTEHYAERAAEIFAANLKMYAAGGIPEINRLNASKLY